MEQVKKHIFWIVMGVLLLAAIAASHFITGPVRAENERQLSELKRRIGHLERYASPDRCKNKRWIKHAKDHQALIRDEEKDVEGYLLESAEEFPPLFSEDRNDPDARELRDPALWKDRYKEELAFLEQKLGKAQVLLGSRHFHTRLPEWGDRVPKLSEMVEANREYWIIEDVCKIVLNLKDERDRNRVWKLLQIGFPGEAGFQEEKLTEGQGWADFSPKRVTIRKAYMPIPVVVLLEIDSKYLEKLVAGVLSSPWRYTLHSCEVVRVESLDVVSREDRGGPGEPPPDKVPKERRDLFENSTVRVRLYMEALDFRSLKKSLQKKDEEE